MSISFLKKTFREASALKKRMLVMILFLLIVFGGVFGWDLLRSIMMARFFAHFQPPPVTISTTIAKQQNWQNTLKSVGTVAAVNGVTISPEVSGVITSIDFQSGQMVQQGQLLIKIDDSVEQANLQSAESALKLTTINFHRQANLFKNKVASAAEYDAAKATMEQDQASVNKNKAIIAQMNITAPFAGKAGIRLVNVGQYVSPGTPMVSLQALAPIYINFYVPEQYLPKLGVGQMVEAQIDAYPHEIFKGSISAINSTIDTNTHNVLVQAVFANNQRKLYPGLFANISVIEPNAKIVVTLPTTAINYSLFGDTVYVIQKSKDPEKAANGDEIYTVKQVFVKLGHQTSDIAEVLSGIKAGESVVTSGQLKLDNNARVVINNTVKLDQKQNEIY